MQNRFYFKGSFSNIYKKSSKFSEVTSQILYGEKFKILSKNKSWIKIKSDFDNYTGYIQNKNYSKEFRANYKVSSLKFMKVTKGFSLICIYFQFGGCFVGLLLQN